MDHDRRFLRAQLTLRPTFFTSKSARYYSIAGCEIAASDPWRSKSVTCFSYQRARGAYPKRLRLGRVIVLVRFADSFSTAFERCISTHLRALLLLSVFSLACFSPGFFSLPPMDRDEPRFAQASKQMLESLDFVSIRFQDEARNKKPVGIYWAQAAAVAVAEAAGLPNARTTSWVYRLPSLAGALGAVLLTYWAALAFVVRPYAVLAALALASTILVGVEARLAKTDAVVLATVIASMGAFARIYLRRSSAADWRTPLIFWGAIGVGLLVKGPITPMIPLLAGVTLAVRDRGAPWLRDLHLPLGVCFALAISAPWFIVIMVKTEGAFLAASLGDDMLRKVASGQESHGAPPLTYLATFWALAWPIAPMAAIAAPSALASRNEPGTGFLLAWLLPAWIVFEATPTKLPHYVLPLYPAIVILIAAAASRGHLDLQRGWKAAIPWVTPLIALIAVVGAGGFAFTRLEGLGLIFLFLAPPAVAASCLAASLDRPASLRLGAAFTSALLFYPAIYVGLINSSSGATLALSPRLVNALGSHALSSGCPRLAVATAGFNEPSFVFLSGTDTRVGLDGRQAAGFVSKASCHVAIVDIRHEGAFLEALPNGANVNLVTRVAGININGGRKLDLGVWAAMDGGR